MSAEANSAGQSSSPLPPSEESLQFEKAEFSQGAALACAFCNAPITGPYFQVNAQTACPDCRQKIETTLSGGSKTARAFRALAAGLTAGVAGFLIYWGIRAATGYEFALVAILIGYMVGVAVRWGAQRRGGAFYQLMAVVLTYFSIASNYTPDVIQGMRQSRSEASAAAISTSTATSSPNQTNAAPLVIAPADRGERAVPFWFMVIFAFFVSLTVPFLAGPSNILGWIIIAVGLFEAWKLNKRVPIQVSGPFDAPAQPPALA